MSVCVAIPARLASSRLTGKVLRRIGSRTMLELTHEVARRADVGPVVVLADDASVADEVRAFGGRVLLTDPALTSGTARIASAIDQLDADVVVNLQADAPLTDPAVVAETARHTAEAGDSVVLPVARCTTTPRCWTRGW